MADQPPPAPVASLGPDPALAPYALAPRTGGWQSVLAPDERLLWQGRPDRGLRLGARQIALAVVGLVLVALSIGLAAQGLAGRAAGDAQAGAVLTVAVLGAVLGAGCAVWPALADMLRRRGTAYALTDRRAFIETNFLGYGLAAWPIGANSPVWRSRGRRVASVWFAVYTPPLRAMLLRPSGRMTGARPIGFEYINDPDHVLRLVETVRARN